MIEGGGEVYRSPEAERVPALRGDPVAEGCGVPIGSYLSQWSGALYLDGLDHFVLRTLKVPGYLRYADDFALFGDDAGRLAEAREAIAVWLAEQRQLELSPKKGRVAPAGEPSVFLGVRVSRSGLAPGPKVRRRMPGKVREASRKGPAALIRTLRSYRGSLRV